MWAKVTHESPCRIYFLNRTRPFCGGGNVFVFPAFYAELSVNYTASIYQCYIFLLKKRCISLTLHPFSEKMLRFEQQGAVPWKICCSLSSSVAPALSYFHRQSFLFASRPVASNIWRVYPGPVFYRTRLGQGKHAPFPELFASSLAVLNLAALLLIMCPETVLQQQWAFCARSAFAISNLSMPPVK